MSRMAGELREAIEAGARPFLLQGECANANKATQLRIGGRKSRFRVRHMQKLAQLGLVRAELDGQLLRWYRA